MLDRRRFFTLPAALPLFGPWRATPQVTVAGNGASLWLPGGGVFTCTSSRVHMISVLHLRAMAIAALSFAVDPPDATQDVLALVNADGHLLALERLTCRRAGVGGIVTQVAMMPDREHISLQRHATSNAGLVRQESWTDYLRVSERSLVNAPQRPPLAGTWQHALSEERQQCESLMADAQTHVPPAALTLLGRSFPF